MPINPFRFLIQFSFFRWTDWNGSELESFRHVSQTYFLIKVCEVTSFKFTWLKHLCYIRYFKFTWLKHPCLHYVLQVHLAHTLVMHYVLKIYFVQTPVLHYILKVNFAQTPALHYVHLYYITYFKFTWLKHLLHYIL